jgi:hypothetical protein
MHCRPASQKSQIEMNLLPMEKQIQIVSALVAGNSVRSTARMVTPALEAGIAYHVWTIEEVVGLLQESVQNAA